jgi:hypothetical protein
VKVVGLMLIDGLSRLLLVGEAIKQPLRQRALAEASFLKRKSFLVLLPIANAIIVVLETKTSGTGAKRDLAANSDSH